MNEEFKQKQEKEALERLKLLKTHYNMHPNVLSEYKKEKLIYFSEHINQLFSGILWWVNNNEKYVNKIKEIEEKYNILVYHCILTHYEIGDIMTMLYVGTEEEYWEGDREDLINGYPYVYGWNIDDDFCSEFGSASIIGINGGLRIN